MHIEAGETRNANCLHRPKPAMLTGGVGSCMDGLAVLYNNTNTPNMLQISSGFRDIAVLKIYMHCVARMEMNTRIHE
jgi:hypothetical protein